MHMAALLCWTAVIAQDASTDSVAPPESTPVTRQSLIIVTGAAGTDEYGKQFAQWAQRWRTATAETETDVTVIDSGDDATKPTRLDQFKTTLAMQPKRSPSPLWIVLIGHGTFDGKRAMFNLSGPDLSADELNTLLKPFERTIVLINCASASAPFMTTLADTNRVIVTATKSGYEFNFARFGDYMSRAIENAAQIVDGAHDGDSPTDLDKDGQVSLLEAYLSASRRVEAFYESEGRLATEQALLDDTGDGKGTPAAWFRGVRAVQRAADGASLDGVRAHQLHLIPSTRERAMPAELRARRDDLELKIAALRERKSEMAADAYYATLEPMLIELAKLYEAVESD